VNYYNLGPGGSYAGILCQWGLLDPLRGPLGSCDGGIYLGIGGGAGFYLAEGLGVEATATAGYAFPFGMAFVHGGMLRRGRAGGGGRRRDRAAAALRR
jgi:hypothetical protein